MVKNWAFGWLWGRTQYKNFLWVYLCGGNEKADTERGPMKFFFFFFFVKYSYQKDPLQQMWSVEEIVQPEMVKVKSRSCQSSSEKQVKGRSGGGRRSVCIKQAGGRQRGGMGWRGGVRSDRPVGQSQQTRRQQTFECCHKTVLHYKVCTVHTR